MSDESEPGERTAGASWLARLFLVAAALRIAAIFTLGAPEAAASGKPWPWGHECASLAQALLDGRGYSDPWGKGTGPSSWLTPPYPLLVAGVMALFGGVTRATAIALGVIHALLSAANCVVLVKLGERCGLARSGKWAGWLFALYPIAISNSAQLVWDSTLVALCLTGFLWLLVGFRGAAASAVSCGVAYGALLFVNPAPMSLAPIVLWFVAHRSGSTANAARNLALFAGFALVAVAPWMARNASVLGAFTLRPNFGVELRIGNHDEANGRPIAFRYHPSHVSSELELYRELGEVGYARNNTERALEWIGANPGAFTTLTLKRAALFWIGESPLTDPRRSDRLSPRGDVSSWIKFVSYLGAGAFALVGLARWRGERDVRVLFAGASLLFGAPYYLTHVSERYRFPIDPLLVLLAACALVEWMRGRETTKERG